MALVVDTTDRGQPADFVSWVEEQIPFNRVLGITVLGVDRTRARIGLTMRQELVGNFTRNSLHGGVISATLDLVGGMAALLASAGQEGTDFAQEHLDRFSNFGTIDLRVDYLRPGVGLEFEATGFALRTGKRVAVTRMEFRNEEDQLIAVGTGTYALG
jgi:uncharacterized protein (TIGR00369 family)